MSVFEIIKQRRSIGKMTGERPSRGQIERLLEAATHAPNHHKVQPWKFIVLAGSAREELGMVMAVSLLNRLEETSSEKAQAMLNKERNKLMRSPVVIVVAAEIPHQPNVLEIENIEATAAAVQNMLLAGCGAQETPPMMRVSSNGSDLRRRSISYPSSTWAFPPSRTSNANQSPSRKKPPGWDGKNKKY